MEVSAAGVAGESGNHGIRSDSEARMTLPFILFFVLAFLAVAGAVMLIVAREPIHSALSLILVMISLAVLYLLLGAEFIAGVQIIVYAGAIMVLFVFVIMLLNAGVEERTDFSKLAKYIGYPLAFFMIIEVAFFMARSIIGRQIATGSAENTTSVSTEALSRMIFQQYLLPFEATSILILIAIVGALVLAKKGE
jgi:NADH-quinone oxidoreductase subunit J